MRSPLGAESTGTLTLFPFRFSLPWPSVART